MYSGECQYDVHICVGFKGEELEYTLLTRLLSMNSTLLAAWHPCVRHLTAHKAAGTLTNAGAARINTDVTCV